jgi:hypothetical protein
MTDFIKNSKYENFTKMLLVEAEHLHSEVADPTDRDEDANTAVRETPCGVPNYYMHYIHIYTLYIHTYIHTYLHIKIRRIAWLGHAMRMDEKRTPKRILEWKRVGRRIRGRPRKRWIEDIEDDVQIMGIRGWRKLCKEREEWTRITEKAENHSGL